MATNSVLREMQAVNRENISFTNEQEADSTGLQNDVTWEGNLYSFVNGPNGAMAQWSAQATKDQQNGGSNEASNIQVDQMNYNEASTQAQNMESQLDGMNSSMQQATQTVSTNLSTLVQMASSFMQILTSLNAMLQSGLTK